ncbi:hypothetical protein ACO2RV_21220 [Ancylobacter sp. VNQ12]|uniref:hypothetical protein n=1 Tax=Ancylobacter sp. VNQ12 TaxID=3400920 RepID=UPI003BFB9ABD
MSTIADFLASRMKELTPEKWDSFIRFLDSRFSPLEEQVGIEKRVSDAILQPGLQVIEDGIGPSIIKAQESAENLAAMADLGAVFFATSNTSLVINTNEKVLTIPDNRRGQFAPTAYLLVTAAGSYENGFVGRRLSYDRLTGVLTLAVEQTMGEGSFSNWSVGPVATTADLEALRDQVAGDKIDAQTARAGAETARGQAEGFAGAANTAKTGAQAALADLRAAVAMPITNPGASSVGRLWYDGTSVRVFDGTGWVTAVTASLGGLRFEEGTFGVAPDGVITVGGGFTTAMVFVDGLKLASDAFALDSPTITVASPIEGQHWSVRAYQALSATDYYTKQEVNDRVNPKAPLNSPTFTGAPTAPTPNAADDSSRIATTSFVQSLIEVLSTIVNGKAPLASPTFTGKPTVPTPAAGDSTARIPNTSWVQARIAALAATVAAKLNLSGGVLSGQVTSTASIAVESQSNVPRLSFHIPSVFRKYLQMASNGSLNWIDQAGTAHHTFAGNGQIWTQAYGWLHDRFAAPTDIPIKSPSDLAQMQAVYGGISSLVYARRSALPALGTNVSGSTLSPPLGGTWKFLGGDIVSTPGGGSVSNGLYQSIS